jgi:hypothetical protein
MLKPGHKNKYRYEDFEYCAYTLARLAKQHYDGKDMNKSRVALRKFDQDLRRYGDIRTQFWLEPAVRAMLGEHR